MTMTAPETSIIIRAFNEEKYLPALFDAIEQQTYQDFETIVVDSHSYDRTRQIANERADELVQVERHDFTFGHSLNAGIEAAQGALIAIVSAHTEPTTEGWLENLVSPLREEGVAMVYGRQRGTDDSKFSERLDFIRTFTDGRRELEPPNFFANNANSAVRYDLWTEHPFDETLPGLEDIAWAKHWMEQGYKVVYEPSSTILHIHEETWPQVRHRYYREAQAAKWIGVKHPSDSFELIGQEARWLLSDLRTAKDSARGSLLDTTKEIVRFRYNKLRGTLEGLLDGARMENPTQRRAIYFDKPFQALVVDGPGNISLKDRSPPDIRPGEVLVEVNYAGICGTDLEILDGTLGYYEDGTAEYPIVPGHEISGVITDVGANVDHLEPEMPVVVECIQGCGRCEPCGDEQWTACHQRKEVGVVGRDGGFAEYLAVPAHFVQQIPPGISLQEACLTEPLAVVHKALRRLRSAWPDGDSARRCSVVGAGSIGNLMAQLLALHGHPVDVHDIDSERLSALESSQLDINTSHELEPLLENDIVIEATGSPDVLEQVLERTKPASTILLLGLPYGEKQFNFEKVVAYDKTVIGSVGSTSEDFSAALELLPKFDLGAFQQNIVPLHDYERAFQGTREGTHLKTILRISDNQ